MGKTLSELGFKLGNWDSDELCNSSTVIGVDLYEVSEHLLLNVSSALTKWPCEVLSEVLSVSLAKNFSIESSGLLVVVIRVVVSISTNVTSHFGGRPFVLWAFNRTA